MANFFQHYDLLQLLIEAKADPDDEDEEPPIKSTSTLSDIEVASIATSFLLAGSYFSDH